MTINEEINNFLRDAQYRVATLSTEIDEIEDNGSYLYSELTKKRLELTTFMDVVYEGKWFITDGYNHIQYTETSGETDKWTEREVIQEIQHLRYYTSMNEVPFINFTAHYPQIVTSGEDNSGEGSGTDFPAGQPGDTIFYDASGNPYADSIDKYAGMFTGETINSYFSDRL